jgi:hypothetical protein
MFESVRPPDAAERLRAAAAFPFAALLLALLYFTLYPTLTRVPPALFWSVDAIVFLGAVAGVVAVVRIARHERIGGRALAWLAIAGIVTLVCVWLVLAFTFPWL